MFGMPEWLKLWPCPDAYGGNVEGCVLGVTGALSPLVREAWTPARVTGAGRVGLDWYGGDVGAEAGGSDICSERNPARSSTFGFDSVSVIFVECRSGGTRRYYKYL